MPCLLPKHLQYLGLGQARAGSWELNLVSHLWVRNHLSHHLLPLKVCIGRKLERGARAGNGTQARLSGTLAHVNCKANPPPLLLCWSCHWVQKQRRAGHLLGSIGLLLSLGLECPGPRCGTAGEDREGV